MNPVMTRTRYRKTNAAFTVSREYDVLDRVTDIVYAARDGTPLYALSYAYDPDGLVTRRGGLSHGHRPPGGGSRRKSLV